ncbi:MULTISPECIES: ornithine carbamoyltransferase [unclassified Streptomyces]|uniref:ornithine carbamoyltransferase n=1 Tax=unclassified Streptomyces TaxID=2593676 RepID=UPI001CC0D6A4|nr:MULTISPECIES: ornithine carbamoyltransferase [unclassified Streptomyces]WPO71688.1 ornithine carbamoyltransferase [Streptomyces sp. KN37]
MTISGLKGRSLLSLREFSGDEIRELLGKAADLKERTALGENVPALAGKNIALIFLKPSCRTRVSFVVASTQSGAHPEIFNREDIRFGIKESVRDIARVFGRVFDGVMFRGFEHATVAEFAQYAGVPVWNGLCDSYHPTQVLADLLTLRENFGDLEGLPLTYVGDGRNNMAVTLAIAAAKLGLDLRILAPAPLQPAPEVIEELLAGRESEQARVLVTHSPEEALRGSACVYGDVWVSMGEEDQTRERIDLLRDLKVTSDLMALTGREDSIYLHCLPAFHLLDTETAIANPDICEVDDDVFEGEQSRVFDQSENRMHTAKALMQLTIAG